MSRKRMAKGNVRRQATNNIFATVSKMEQDFLGAPLKMGDQLTKHINTLKQKESKLKNAINKSQSQTKISENRIKTATSKSNNPTGRKQLSKAKKAHLTLMQNHTGLNKQLQETTKLLATATTKQAKLTALRKHLNQFEKEWSKNAKQLKAKASSKPTAKKTVAAKLKLQPSNTPQQQPAETYETSIDDSRRVDEEVTS